MQKTYFNCRQLKPLFITIFTCCLLNMVSAQSFTADDVFAKLQEAFSKKDAGKLQPVLADEFSVGVYTMPTAQKLLAGIIAQYKTDSISKTAVESIEGKKYFGVTFYLPNHKKKESRVWLNEDNQLLYVDLFDELYRLNRYGNSQLKAVIPFEVDNGSIILTAKLNQFSRPLKFLFDTGADGMAVKKELADSLGLIISRSQSSSVVGGSQKITVSEGNSVFFDKFELKKQSVAIFQKMDDKYDGIIGNTMAREYIVKVDYNKQVLELYNFGDYKNQEPGTSVPIAYSTGVPALPINFTVGSQSVNGNFIFDTGAGYYLIVFGPFVKDHLLLTNGFVPWFSSSTISMGHASPTYTGIFADVELGNTSFKDFPGTLKAFMPGDEKWNPGADGSLGIKLISRFNFTLNLAEKTIFLSPNKYFNQPNDFMIGNWYMGFNDKNEIEPSLYNGADAEGQEIKKGDVIIAINNTDSKTLCNNPNQLKKILALPANKILFSIMRDGKVVKIKSEN